MKVIESTLEDYSSRREGQYFDRKSSRIKPKDILKTLVAFANADGGSLLIGQEDDGRFTGFKTESSHKMEEFKSIALTELRETPILVGYETINMINEAGAEDLLLLIHVDPSTERVIKSFDGNVYLRQFDKSIRLNHEQILQLEYDRGQRYFEDELVQDSSLDDIDEEIMELYKKHMKLDETTAEDILKARNFLRNGKITNAGILLFSNNPTKYLPQARVKFIKYSGMRAGVGHEINIVKEETFDEAIPKIILKIQAFIKTQLREFQYLDQDGVFKKMPEYPEFAWFEGVVNALTHRNYSIRGEHIKVIMFDDRIEIYSPGLLPNIVTIENILQQRYSRNPRIARILSEFGWVKEMNEGVKRIYSEMEKFYLKTPVYSEPNNNVLLLLENNILNRRLRIADSLEKIISGEIFKTLNEIEKGVVRFAFQNEKITVSSSAKIIEKSPLTTRNILKKLEKIGILEWHGTNLKDPTQYYTLKQSSNEN